MDATLTDEAVLVEALRRGDEDAFMRLVERYHASMIRIARMYVQSLAVAEEVVQETWLAMLEGLDRFEGRSTLKTWLFRILTNRAKTRGEREGRSVPFSSVEPDDPGSEPGPFQPDGHWVTAPERWPDMPDDLLLASEVRERVSDAIAALPHAQREVITLRDVEGLGSAEVAGLLGITDGNQRVLLHRARAKVRRELERYLVDER